MMAYLPWFIRAVEGKLVVQVVGLVVERVVLLDAAQKVPGPRSILRAVLRLNSKASYSAFGTQIISMVAESAIVHDLRERDVLGREFAYLRLEFLDALVLSASRARSSTILATFFASVGTGSRLPELDFLAQFFTLVQEIGDLLLGIPQGSDQILEVLVVERTLGLIHSETPACE